MWSKVNTSIIPLYALIKKSKDQPSLIEGGRTTADPEFGVIRYNFQLARPERALTSSIWFVRDDRDNKHQPILVPLTSKDNASVETLYQTIIAADGKQEFDKVSKEETTLDDGKYSAMLKMHDATTYVMRKCPVGSWGFGRSYDLQRGYGFYTVEGEEEEETLGPIRHLLFVIHGVGEAMWSREDASSNSIHEEMINIRLIMQQQQIAEWKKNCETAKKENRPEQDPPNRVELIPILWYDRIHSSSNKLMTSIQSTTLPTIPGLRDIANDVILDVLMYLTPAFCYDTLEIVTDRIIETYKIFNKIHPDFSANGGKCSLVGHSLGSVICWDLLSILKEYNHKSPTTTTTDVIDLTSDSEDEFGVHISHHGGHASQVGYQQYASGENANEAKNGTYGPCLPKPMERCLPFIPDFTMFLGSPLGLFLSLRGAHAVFDELRATTAGDGKGTSRVSPFTLPTGSMHNIFHPSDPIAYRIEPLLLAQGTKDVPEPVYLTREGEGVRLHVKALQMGNSISNFMGGLFQKMDERHELENKSNDKSNAPLRFFLAGQNERVDYQLQPRVIDNEYLSAVTAHSSYFANTDVIDYIIDLTRGKNVELIIGWK